eukprot:6114120-Amphidinium_carterae.2
MPRDRHQHGARAVFCRLCGAALVSSNLVSKVSRQFSTRWMSSMFGVIDAFSSKLNRPCGRGVLLVQQQGSAQICIETVQC